ncbi:hypothetical protein QX776_01815 [Alteromonadaceae bacterium BrNp21-10]|nr:hypothetical protein [Alteromonadaceae bacterium BrNp21-10]
MLFFNVGEEIILGNGMTCLDNCPCGSTRFWPITEFKYLSFAALPILPMGHNHSHCCVNCFRVANRIMDEGHQYPRVQPMMKLSKFIGWPLIFIIIYGLILFVDSVHPEDIQYRQLPMVGDVYFFDYYQFSNDLHQHEYPFRMAKVTSVNLNESNIEIKLSRFSYSSEWDLLRDYSIRRDGYDSYFMPENKNFSIQLLLNDSIVLSVRRRIDDINIESLQIRTEYKRKTLLHPTWWQ